MTSSIDYFDYPTDFENKMCMLQTRWKLLRWACEKKQFCVFLIDFLLTGFLVCRLGWHYGFELLSFAVACLLACVLAGGGVPLNGPLPRKHLWIPHLSGWSFRGKSREPYQGRRLDQREPPPRNNDSPRIDQPDPADGPEALIWEWAARHDIKNPQWNTGLVFLILQTLILAAHLGTLPSPLFFGRVYYVKSEWNTSNIKNPFTGQPRGSRFSELIKDWVTDVWSAVRSFPSLSHKRCVTASLLGEERRREDAAESWGRSCGKIM